MIIPTTTPTSSPLHAAATAIVAEDEPLLAADLTAKLHGLWPALQIVGSVGHGEAALEQALAMRPDVLFLDIRMPGMTGLEAASALAEDWPDDGTPFPLIVFVTAYDQYALQAFERAAVDYVLKPVQSERLAETCQRLQAALRARAAANPSRPSSASDGAASATLAETVAKLRELLGPLQAPGPLANAGALSTTPAPAAPLRVIQAGGSGNAIHLVPIGEVVYFEAADKYVRVLTASRELLIRTSLRELMPRLDSGHFWQIHRGTVVRADAIASASRDEAGKVTIALRERPETLAVSRLYAHLFKAM